MNAGKIALMSSRRFIHVKDNEREEHALVLDTNDVVFTLENTVNDSGWIKVLSRHGVGLIWVYFHEYIVT